MNSYPKNYPESCPPSDAQDANGDYYRLVHENPPSENDLLSNAELGLKPKADECLRLGLSVYGTEQGASATYLHFKNLYGEGVRLGALVAKGSLSPKDGKTKQTFKPPHETWWPYEDVDRGSLFTVVKDMSDVES